MPRKTKSETAIGTIHSPKAMILRQSYGNAASDKNTFELSITMAGSPVVFCQQTGKYFSLSWQEILELADKAGIAK